MSQDLRLNRGLNHKLCHDLRGKSFGRLTPLRIDENKKNRVHWICRCECGIEKTILAKSLERGASRSCGKCFRSKSNNGRWRGHQEITGKYWAMTQRNATARGLEFKITMEYVWNLYLSQNKECALTGLPLTFSTGSGFSDGTASLDRIDSRNGYVEGNVWWVDKKVNTIKWDLPLEDFLRICKIVTEYNA
jgi:hypothetical protein